MLTPIAMAATALSAALAAAPPPERPPPPAAQDALAPLLEAWPTADAQDRAQLARVFGLAAHPDASATLRACDGWSCVLALVARGETDAAPALRRILRAGHDDRAVGAAALALGHWRDHFSYGLVLETLFEGRGGGPWSTLALDALEPLRTPWRPAYLTLIARQTPSQPVALALAAETLARDDAAPTRDAARARLVAALDGALHAPEGAWGADPALPFAARTAVWGLTRGARCRLVRDALHAAPPARAEALAPMIQPPCGRWHSPRPRPPLEGIVAGATGRTLREIARRTNLPESLGPALDALGARVDARHRELLGEAPWAPGVAGALAGSTDRVLTPRWTRLVRETAPLTYGPLFDRFQPPHTHSQPAWLPAELQLTIDDGPRLEWLPDILDVLERYGVKATFFFVGSSLARAMNDDPARLAALLDRVVSGGHTVGYHSLFHQTKIEHHLLRWAPEQIADSVRFFRRLLETAAGRPVPVVYGRSPGGQGSDKAWLRFGFWLSGLRAPASWNRGPPAWTGKTPPDDLRRVACAWAAATEPSLVVLHESPGLDDQLRVFLRTLRDRDSVCPAGRRAPPDISPDPPRSALR